MTILLIILLVNCILIVFFFIGWATLPDIQVTKRPETAFSVIVPFRNEGANLPALIRSLEALHYPEELVEFIFVDDHSADDGAARLINHPRAKVVSLEHSGGKKAAIEKGIEISAFDTIITIDADCQVQQDWLMLFNEVYLCDNPDMCLGAIRLRELSRNTLSQFQQLEQLALTGISGAMATIGAPVMCNGANLSYRKEAFYAVGGFAGNGHIPSGDDQFLLNKMRRAGKRISYVRHSKHTVTTSSQNGWFALRQQRIRWAGKWRQTGGILALLALLTALSSLAFVLAWLILPWQLSYWPWVAGVTFAKFMLEFNFVRRVGQDLGVASDWWRWPLFELCYPFYALYIAVVANAGHYEWKGRQYSAS